MLATIDDDTEIADLFTQLVDAVDRRDIAAMAYCFASDASARLGGVELVGRDAIVDYVARERARCGTTKHLLGNPVVDVDGDVALLAVDIHFIDADPERLRVIVGRARTRCTRTPLGWRLTDHLFDPIRTEVHR